MIIKAEINVPDKIKGKCYNNDDHPERPSEHCDWLETCLDGGNFCIVFEQDVNAAMDKCEKCETQCRSQEAAASDEFALDALGNHVRVGDYVIHQWRLRKSKWYHGKTLMLQSKVAEVYPDRRRIRVAAYQSLIAWDRENSPDTMVIRHFVLLKK